MIRRATKEVGSLLPIIGLGAAGCRAPEAYARYGGRLASQWTTAQQAVARVRRPLSVALRPSAWSLALRLFGQRAKSSTAVMLSSRMAALPLWPASDTNVSRASGQARARCQAVSGGLLRS